MRRLTLDKSNRNLLCLITLVSVILIVGFAIQSCRRTTPRPFGAELVRGYLAAAVGSSPQAESSGFYSREISAKEIYLPGVNVFLEDTASGMRSDEVKTDLSGRFTVRVPGDAQYRLCWTSKIYGDGCLQNKIHAGHEPVFLSTVVIKLERRQGFVASFGKVRFEDDSIPRTLEPMADINSFATISLLDSNKNQMAEVPVNNFGDYLLPYLPDKDRVEVVARIEGMETTQFIQPEAYSKGRRLVRYQLTIKNSRPRLDAIVPTSAATGKRVQIGAPSDTLTLKAVTHDRNGDAVQVQWSENGGNLSAKTGDEIRWTLPREPGRYSVVAIASDKKGGYDSFTVRLSVGTPGVPFSGVVAGSDGALIDGAEVDVNGKIEKTDNRGRFINYVPEAERYVFNIRKPGYGFYSKIYDRSVAGGRWTLTRATVSTFNPGNDIVVQDRRDEKNCPGADSTRVNWREGPALAQVWWQDGKGNNIPPPFESRDDQYRGQSAALMPWRERKKQGGCGPGIGIRIPANGLQTSSGAAPGGQVEVTLSTVDLDTPEQMPGDDTIDQGGGRFDWMQSFGAGSVELRDTSTGERLQLKPNVLAEVTIPVDRSQLDAGVSLRASMPLLFYDETKGMWIKEGSLQLDGARQNYVAKVKHFSTINADVEFGSPACIAVQSTLSTPYDLELTIPMVGGAAPKVKKITVTDPPPHVLYNLPINTNVTIVAIAPGPPPRSLGIFIVNTGPAHATGFGTPPPASACANTVTLSAQTFPGQPNPPGQFLHGLFSFVATTINEADIPVLGTLSQQLDQATINYYNNVDPASDRDTLTKFKTKNGFTAPGPGFQLCGGNVCEDPDTEINVVFANSGDLGFGRDMHCRRTNTGGTPAFDYACYVTNYGDITTDDALDAQNARTNTGVVATVAMEFSPILSTDPVTDRHVKFYVYNAAGNRVNNADLDGQGKRPVPQLCMVCHSGAYPGGGTVGVPTFNTPASVKLGSRFLPFDLRFYTFPASPDKTAHQSAMKHLNEDIVRNAPSIPAPDPIADVITGMYLGSSTQREEFVVSGWESSLLPGTVAQENFYKRVVGNACRTCHIAQPFPALRFANVTDFLSNGYLGFAETRVCSELVMPHAKRTHDIFWGQYWQTDFGNLSPTIAAQFQVFGDSMKALPTPAGWVGTWPPAWNGERCGPFTGGGSTPPSFYSSFVHILWTRNYGTGAVSGCSTCHSEASGNASDTHTAMLASAGFFNNGPPAVVIPNDATTSHLMLRVTGTSIGNRMPQNCPIPQRRCLNEAGGGYNPATDTNPATTSTEVDRIRFWINNNALP